MGACACNCYCNCYCADSVGGQGGGGAGWFVGTAAPAANVVQYSSQNIPAGNPGTKTAGGVATTPFSSTSTWVSTTDGCAGGNGGGLGQPGQAGTNGTMSPGASGGNPGAAVVGNSFVSWVNQGTILGSVS